MKWPRPREWMWWALIAITFYALVFWASAIGAARMGG